MPVVEVRRKLLAILIAGAPEVDRQVFEAADCIACQQLSLERFHPLVRRIVNIDALLRFLGNGGSECRGGRCGCQGLGHGRRDTRHEQR